MAEANDQNIRPDDNSPEAAGVPTEWQTPKPKKLAEPTYWPIILASGVTFLAWGTLTSYLLSILGLVLTVVAVINWIGDIRHEQGIGHNEE
ncbi:MAG: hypothetical protein PVH24_05880 [Candidatus Zixiibacteriota bacterium]|jgi:hypothetical protein